MNTILKQLFPDVNVMDMRVLVKNCQTRMYYAASVSTILQDQTAMNVCLSIMINLGAGLMRLMLMNVKVNIFRINDNQLI